MSIPTLQPRKPTIINTRTANTKKAPQKQNKKQSINNTTRTKTENYQEKGA
ncbi:hypothetical protein HMPREF0658_1093 [Hoylesella marshii DSM 16973 = JCM 13450]|uniref:Uncharacterized protein n=1 Tax=Hoylesella marshii DSM 16973 = JCM 13450 TaxID=862515 RepID=E0NSE2_9BACT|nr:hypothetical protein HMPREF0658_1093 [Hoylesella marshii DSM 16973 = JCM 13450]